MKKALQWSVLIVAVICIVFSCGIFVGRLSNKNNSSLTASQTSVPDSDVSESYDQSLININTASIDLLQTLPGIGETLAKRIIDYRETNGPFTSVQQLTNVEGIGNKTIENIIDKICLED